MPEEHPRPYVLGLDLGVASIGWALLDAEVDGDGKPRPVSIRAVGSHLFEAGVSGGDGSLEKAITQGNEQSKAVPRRIARSMRRQTMRRARRKKKLLGVLIRFGLLPEGDIRSPEAIDTYVKSLDAGLKSTWCPAGTSHADHQTVPYRLRAEAALRPLSHHEVGRALYHLAQRRGFWSNRKAPEREADTKSQMKQDIRVLEDAIAGHSVPTLGAYLASLDPDEKRLRNRWTSRKMYLDEFEAIWGTQAAALDLSDEAKKAIHDAIFHQRPLKNQNHLVGRCSLEPGRVRAPIGLRIAQEFRLLQQVNHLRVVFEDLSERALERTEREKLLAALRLKGDLTMHKAKKAAGLPAGVKFSIERGKETRLVGHRTDAKLRKIFGERWDAMDEYDKDLVVQDMRSVRLPSTLESIGVRRWGLSREQAEELADERLEEGHSGHSVRALQKLVPRMDGDGLSYSEARKDEYQDAFDSAEPIDALPPLKDWEKDLRNPSVARALTELRKLVNAIIARHGKPTEIHIELARDLKGSRKQRKSASDRMRDRQKERTRAAEQIIAQPGLGIDQPKRSDIEKVLLADECDWTCPFTGKCFGMADLLGSTPQVQVEHIWPLSRSLDNSYLNKTLCLNEENARKGRHTPREAYGTTPEQYEAILDRVRRFKGDRFAVREKLRRFTEPLDDGFRARHLNETRYISKLACEYLGLLYGGRHEGQGSTGRTQKLVTPTGILTAWLRRGWHLDGVLGYKEEKEREDHRHHAIDAIVVALANQRNIQRLANAAEEAERKGQNRAFGTVEAPWDGFEHDVREVIRDVVVSHRQSRRLRGPLHQDTVYSDKIKGKHRVSKELHKLTPKEVSSDQVVDKRARAVIRSKLEELGEPDPRKAFKPAEHAPFMKGANGALVRLRRVRIEVGVKPTRFGGAKGPGSARYAKPELNHHVAFYDKALPGGGVERKAMVVPLHEAMRRMAKGEPVVDRTPRGTKGEHAFAFSLAKNEYVWYQRPNADREELFVVDGIGETVSAGRTRQDIELVRPHDGRGRPDRAKTKDRVRVGDGNIRSGRFSKAHVTHLGEVRRAGG